MKEVPRPENNGRRETCKGEDFWQEALTVVNVVTRSHEQRMGRSTGFSARMWWPPWLLRFPWQVLSSPGAAQKRSHLKKISLQVYLNNFKYKEVYSLINEKKETDWFPWQLHDQALSESQCHFWSLHTCRCLSLTFTEVP